MAELAKSGTKVKLTDSTPDKHSQVVAFRYCLKSGQWQEAKLAFDATNSRDEILASIKEYVANLDALANATPVDLSADLGREYDLTELPDRLELIQAQQKQA